MMHKDSEEAKKFLEEKKNYDDKIETYFNKTLLDKYIDEDGQTKYRVLKNKFNFIDRASQTFNNHKRVLFFFKFIFLTHTQVIIFNA